MFFSFVVFFVFWLKRVLIYSSIRISLCVLRLAFCILHFATGATSKPKNEAYCKAQERLQQVVVVEKCAAQRVCRVSHIKKQKQYSKKVFFLKTELTAGVQSEKIAIFFFFFFFKGTRTIGNGKGAEKNFELVSSIDGSERGHTEAGGRRQQK